MTSRSRWWLIAAITIVLLVSTTAFAVVEWQRYRDSQSAPSVVDVISAGPVLTGPRVVFRNTAPGSNYGRVAAVPLEAPAGPRTIADLVCDRVDASPTRTLCLRVNRGIVTNFEATTYDADGEQERRWSLPGIPSRARLSDDSERIATTSFVTGQSYATIGFSTATDVSDVAGTQQDNLEEFEFIVDGERVTSVDRNFWGVTFAGADTFYATAASGGNRWLVRGDLSERTLVAIRDGVECPSISPDGTRLAYKKDLGSGEVLWAIAVLDLATGAEIVLPSERSVDDQVEWLDDSTVLYGLPRIDAVGDNDIWAVAADGTSEPVVFIEHAWSPAVVREG
ncbi:Tol biopolymer transport system component [Marisediminicola sp. UYEF4]|uniref:hypothetical protein n=1 Tax=Marisediminicola sp. UYEF4 TaxID=1756384 RepID=UPI00339696E7